MKSLCVIVSGMILGLVYACQCPPTARAATPIPVTPDQLESLTFARIVLRPEASYDILISTEDTRLWFIERLRERHYNVKGAENLIFGKDESARARFQLGAFVTDLKCKQIASTLQCVLAMKWELLDTQKDQVTYSETTEVSLEKGLEEKPDPSWADDLVRRSLDLLLAQQSFVSALQKKVPTSIQSTPNGPVSLNRCSASERKMPDSLPGLVEATVLIRAGTSSIGSGAVISPSGYVLTAAHVLDEEKTVTAVFQNGLELPAVVVRSLPARDVALLKMPGIGHRCLATSAERPALGRTLYAIGAPGGTALAFSVSRGIVSGVRLFEDRTFLQTDASLNAGNSGGPLLNDRGELEGIVSWKVAAVGFEGLSFGIPIDTALRDLEIAWIPAPGVGEAKPASITGAPPKR